MDATAMRDQVEELLGQVEAGLAELVELPVGMPGDVAEALRVLRRVEVVARRLRAVQVSVADAVDRSGVWRAEGHRRGHQLVGRACRLSYAEQLRRDRSMRALRDLPHVAAAMRAGEIGAPQVERIASTWSNPRVREAFCALDREVAELAARVPFDRLDRMLANWEAMVDEEGTAERSAAAHRGRDARLEQGPDGAWAGRFGCGTLDGARMQAIFDAFCRAELAADLAHVREHHGDAATTADLPRTDAQRRFDALARIFERAAGDGTGRAPVVETVVVIDEETFDRHLRRLSGQRLRTRPLDLHGDPPLDPDRWASMEEPVDLADVQAAMDWRDEHRARERARRAGRPYRSHTIDGHFVDPTEAVANAICSHVRRAVVTTAGVTIDLSRRQRLFAGHAALAARIAATSCYWPGCRVPTSHCQTDHLTAWTDGGPTDQANAAMACGYHNRLKDHGFTVHRRRDGTIAVHRPDGTPIE